MPFGRGLKAEGGEGTLNGKAVGSEVVPRESMGSELAYRCSATYPLQKKEGR